MRPNLLKRLLICTFALTPCFSGLSTVTASAEGQAASAYEKKRIEYRAQLMKDDVTDDDLLIGSWFSFYSFERDSFEDQLEQMAAAGINFNIFPKDFGGHSLFDAEYWTQIEQAYSQRNMVYLMTGGTNPEWVSIASEYATGKDHCLGFYIKDEPTADALDTVARQSIAFRTADPSRFPLTNLFPSYAEEDLLGGSYREYVEAYVKKVGAENIGYLSHDNYPFLKNDQLRRSIFSDMEVLRSVAYENGKLKTHAFTQSSAWSWTRMPNIDEMRWNAYGYLAYGFKALTWFNLVCPGTADNDAEGFYDSLIYRDGTIRDPVLFESWSDLNWEIRGLSPILMNTDVSHAYHVVRNVSGVELLPKDFFLQPDSSLENDFIVSVLEPKTGNEEHIMIFNKNFTHKSTKCLFQIDESKGIEGIEYFDPLTGEYIPVDISGNTLGDSFRPGEGRLYRLSYGEEKMETTEATKEAQPKGKALPWIIGSLVAVGGAAIATATTVILKRKKK